MCGEENGFKIKASIILKGPGNVINEQKACFGGWNVQCLFWTTIKFEC